MRVALILSFVAATATAQLTPTIIDLETSPVAASSNPRFLTPVGDRLFFVAGQTFGRHQPQLWIADGTPDGLIDTGVLGVTGIQAIGSTVYYTTDEGKKLWRYDAAAQTLLHESSSVHKFFTPIGGALYFINETQLWKSDGTPAGTKQVTHLDWSGPLEWQASPVENIVFFSTAARNGLGELWKTDGTESGTVRVFGFDSTARPHQFCSAGGIIYFVFNDDVWRTDGTSAGTRRLSEPRDQRKMRVERLVSLGDRVLFTATLDFGSREIWTTDGTAAGTVPLTHFSVGTTSGIGGDLLVTSEGIAVFQSLEPSKRFYQLSRTDGTVAGTYVLDAAATGTLAVAGRFVYYFVGPRMYRADPVNGATTLLWEPDKVDAIVAAGDHVFFSASRPGYGVELWAMTGSEPPELVRDLAVMTSSSFPLFFTAYRGSLMFVTDPQQVTSLWTSDGTPAGTVKLRTLRNLTDLTSCGRGVYFGGNEVYDGAFTTLPVGGSVVACADGTAFLAGNGLWISDGTAAGTARVIGDLAPSRPWYGGDAIGQKALLLRGGANGFLDLWRSDGTEVGTVLVRERVVVGEFFKKTVSGRLFYVASEGAPTKLWRSDGTTVGTFPLVDGGTITSMIDYDGILLFLWTGDDTAAHPSGLYRTDGTFVGTRLLKAMPIGPFNFSNQNAARGHLALFGRYAWIAGDSLMRTDGTPEGTITALSQIDAAAVFGSSSRLFFVRLHAGEPIEFDGSTARVLSPDIDIHSDEMIEIGRHVFASGETLETGNELVSIEQPFFTSEIVPPRGSIAGGERVTIRGGGFVVPVEVTFNGLPAQLVDIAPDAIVVVTPPGDAGGPAFVRIANGDGLVSRVRDGFAYRCFDAVATADATSVCPTTPVALHGRGGDHCAWLPSADLDDPTSCNPIARPLVSTTYRLVASNDGGCSANASVSIAVTPVPIPTIIAPAFASRSTPVTASVSSTFQTYAWSIEHGTIVGSASGKTVAFVSDCDGPSVKLSVSVTSLGCTVTPTRSIPISLHPTIVELAPQRGNVGTVVKIRGSELDCATGIVFGDAVAPLIRAGNGFLVTVPPGARSGQLRVRTRVLPSLAIPTYASFTLRGRTDFTRDARTDIVWRDAANVVVWEMNGAAKISSFVALTLAETSVTRAAGDFDSDGIADLLLGDTRTGALSIAITGGRTIPLGDPGALELAGVGDFDDDGYTDLLWQDATIWFLRNGQRVKTPTLLAPGGAGWSIAAINDFDGNGTSDILWRNTRTDSLLVWSMRGDTIESAQLVGHEPATRWTIETTNDFDGDGRADILWRDASGVLRMWTMSGSTIRSQSVVAAAEPEWRIIGSGDFDGDGRGDMLWRHADGATRLWLMNGDVIVASRPVDEKPNANLTIVSPLR